MKKHIPSPGKHTVSITLADFSALPTPPPIQGTLSFELIATAYGREIDLMSVMDFVETTDWNAIDYCDHEHAADVIESLYWYFVENHGGQFSREYSCQCILGKVFSPGAMDTGISETNSVGELTIS